ncbi:MAG: acyltransferase family protein [Bacteroidaceae bacterium]
MLTPEQVQSKTISLLRFPLIVAVVFIHCTLEGALPAPTPLYQTLVHIIKETFCRIAVPLFFFMSGFLFFYKRDFNRTVYAEKLRKRARTLLVPYLLWNALFILFFWTAQGLFPQMFTGSAAIIRDCSPTELALLFWGTTTYIYPIDYPLWFVRDLMVVMLLSPIVFLLLSRGKQAGLCLLGLLFLVSSSENWNTPLHFPIGFSTTALFFFSFGAYYSIHGRLFTEAFRKAGWPAAAACIILFAASNMTAGTVEWASTITHRAALIAGIVAVVCFGRWGVEREKFRPVPFLWSATFFIYAYHGFFSSAINKIPVRLFPDAPAVLILLFNFATVAILCLLGAAVYKLLERICPRFCALLCGGR